MAGKYCIFFIVSSTISDTVWFLLNIYLKLFFRRFFYCDWRFDLVTFTLFEIYSALSVTFWNFIK